MSELNKDTKICISLSTKPGSLGTKLHNSAYKALGLNFIYKSFYTNNIKDAIKGVRALGIRGCSISMPFKSKVIKLIDKLDKSARTIKAVNTILNKNGLLIGYNTDTTASEILIRKSKLHNNDKILMIGAGGVAKAILHSLNIIGFKNIYVANRTFHKIKYLNRICKVKAIKMSEITDTNFNVFINATPRGMLSSDKIIEIDVLKKNKNRIKLIFDVTINQKGNKLIRFAKKNKIKLISGTTLGRYQAMHQFKIYTGKNPPVKIFLN